jgi:hypothetical protein
MTDERTYDPHSRAHIDKMNARRRELARTDPSRLGGRPRKVTTSEAREIALAELRPKALRVLEEQLEHRDPAIRQRAAIRVLEWCDGRPRQSIDIASRDQPSTIVYVTAATTEGLLPGESIVEDREELPPAGSAHPMYRPPSVDAADPA